MDTFIPYPDTAIAIIGLAIRVPEAATPEVFWQQLRGSFHPLSHFADSEIEQALNEAHRHSLRLVKAGYVLDDIRKFDSAFFGLSPSEADATDPQQRLFLELAWQALERAGYATGNVTAPVGVYSSSNFNTYALRFTHVLDSADPHEFIEVVMGNDKEYGATRLAYLLNLTGPALNVQTACSSSVVSTALACQALQVHQCDLAVVGAAALRARQRVAYLAHDGGHAATDACCRAFDAGASGIADGHGGAAVVLKRYQDAVADHDHIHALILGHAINNDGRRKVGFTAPSVEAQTYVLGEALDMAGVDPGAIGYIEAHGTGTPLGDPIEVSALTQAYGGAHLKPRSIALGSVKTNLGHMDTAAGVTGLVKASLCLQHRELVPSLHFERPNPNIPFEQTPFYVNTQNCPWPSQGGPLAALSGFGLGGTNAHLILAPSPARIERDENTASQLLPLSARTPSALQASGRQLAEFLETHPEARLDDAAYTLQAGRKAFRVRRSLLCHSREDAIAQLCGVDAGSSADPSSGNTMAGERSARLIFLCPGVGVQSVGAGRILYKQERVYREIIDACTDHLAMLLPDQARLADVLIAPPAHSDIAQPHVGEPVFAMLGVFATSLACARLLEHWGVFADGVAGHSLGQYVAAHLAGVMSLPDSVALVVKRAQLLEQTPTGAMLAVKASEQDVLSLLPPALSLGAVNTSALCLVSGLEDDVSTFTQTLRQRRIPHTLLPATRAGHSHLLEPILPAFREAVAAITLHAPQKPLLCNLDGQWISDGTKLTQPDYWVQHLRQTVRFADMVDTLVREPGSLLLELGAGASLANMIKQHAPAFPRSRYLTTLGVKPHEAGREQLLGAIGSIWQHGGSVQWQAAMSGSKVGRIPLPTYPFEREPHWFPENTTLQRPAPAALASTSDDPFSWCYLPTWQPAPPVTSAVDAPRCCWVFEDAHGIGAALSRTLRSQGTRVWSIHAADRFERTGTDFYVDCGSPQDLRQVASTLGEQGQWPDAIFHLWGMAPPADAPFSELEFDLDRGCFSLVYLLQALSALGHRVQCRLIQAAHAAISVSGNDPVQPARSSAYAFTLVAEKEFPDLHCRFVDLDQSVGPERQAARLLTEWQKLDPETSELELLTAWRGTQRFRRTFTHVPLAPTLPAQTPLREGGVYLILGGFGGIGATLARQLARQYRAKLVLAGRTSPPPKPEWGRFVAQHGVTHRVSEHVRLWAELERLGAEVLPVSVDLTDNDSVQAMLAQAQTRFGPLHGIIHAAGVPGGGLIELVNKDLSRGNLDPKLRGIAQLHRHCRVLPLDFMLLCSSVCTQFGAVGQLDNLIGNLAMDAYAYLPDHPYPVLTLGWDFWLEVGMIRELDAQHHAITGEHITFGISPEQAQLLLAPLLALRVPHALLPIDEMKERYASERRHSKRNLNAFEHARIQRPTRVRQALASSYRPAQTDLEQLLVQLWEANLCTRPVGLDDAYLELGGDSLQAMSLVAKVREMLEIELPIRVLFESATIAGLCEFLCRDSERGQRLQTIASVQLQVAAMSLEEINAALTDGAQVGAMS